MTLSGILIFATAYTLAVASPGPGIAAVVGQVLGAGLRSAPALIAGILIGDFTWFILAATGLAAVAEAHAGLFTIVKWLGVAYLFYLAWKMWTSPVGMQQPDDAKAGGHTRLFLSGLTLTLGNPKAITFFVALLPAIIDLQHATLWGLAEVGLMILIILPVVLAGYALFAHAARGFFRSPASMRTLNRVSSTAIAGAAVAIATRG